MIYITLNSFMFMDYTKFILNVILSIIAFLMIVSVCVIILDLCRLV